MADRILIEADAEAWRRTGRAVPHIPNGCDQQGRYLEAAEAATEVGADDDDWEPLTWLQTFAFWAGTLVPLALIVGAAVLASILPWGSQ